MVVTLTNVDKNMLDILKSICKLKPECKIISEEIDEETLEAIQEYERDSKDGKTHIYNSFEDFKKAMSV